MIRIKRRRYLVNKPVQFRYMALLTIPLVFISIALYYLIYYSVFSQMLIPEAVVATLLPAMRQVNFIVLIAAPALFFLILRMALVYSNRIIGPIPRLERELDRVISGERSIRLSARNGDELSSFVAKINELLEKVDKAPLH